MATSLRRYRPLRLELLESRLALTGGPIDTSNRAAVVAAYQQRYLPAFNPPALWTGSTATCTAGATDPAFTAATLDMINYYRAMNGLVEVTFDPILNLKAQQAALMMHAQNALSHAPGPTWKCYTADGADAASHSNLALGASGAEAITLYMEDPGDGNTAVGHRRWILYPHTSVMGTGSTDNANALWVIGTFATNPAPEWTGWPPKGYVPSELVYPRWSLSRENASFQAATVSMTVGGQPVAVTKLPVQDGYGLNTIVWEPQGLVFPPGTADTTVHVVVSNIVDGGQIRSYSYDVQVIDPNSSGVNTAPTISAIPDQVGDEDVPLEVQFTVGDAESPATSLALSATWDNATLLPPGSLAFGGSGASRFLRLVPAANQSGSSLVTITVTDGQLATSEAFTVTFNPVNDLPTLAAIKNYFVVKGGSRAINLTIGDVETPAAQLTLAAESADPLLVPPSGFVFSGTGAARTLTITPAADQEGLTAITVRVNDGADETVQTFDLLVTATLHPWQNPRLNVDVDDDTNVAPNDSLLIINAINARGSWLLPQPGDGFVWPYYYDVTGDDWIAPGDALEVINYINAHPRVLVAGSAAGEGEPAAIDAGLLLYLADAPQPGRGKRAR